MYVLKWLGYLRQYSNSLQAGRPWNWILVGVRYSTPVQTSCQAHTASNTTGAGSFLGLKQPGCDDHPPPSSAKGKERVELYLYTPSEHSWTVRGWTLPLLLCTGEAEGLICYPWFQAWFIWHSIRISVFHRAFFSSVIDKTPTHALFTQHYISLTCWFH